MESVLMSSGHVSAPPAPPAHDAAAPWSSRLPAGQARTLDASGTLRWLRVEQGALWLTAQHSAGGLDSDLWLGPGEAMALPPGTAWVLQAWPEARWSLLVAVAAPGGPPPLKSRIVAALGQRLGAVRAWLRRLRAGPQPA